MAVGVPMSMCLHPLICNIFSQRAGQIPSSVAQFSWEHDTCPWGTASTSPTVNLSVHCSS